MNAKINREARQAAADLLHAVLEGDISSADAIEKWPSNYGDKLVEKVYCLLYHFRDDEDIRSKDIRGTPTGSSTNFALYLRNCSERKNNRMG